MSFRHLLERSWRKNILLAAHLELTYACNLDCVICYNERARLGAPLDTSEWLALIDNLAALGVLTLVLSGGEPTVHPGFFAVGARARQRGFVVRVKTNGHTLRGATLDRLIAEVAPYCVEVSLHGASAATHDRQTRVPGSFARLLDNLRGARGRLRVQLNLPLTRWNEDEIEDVVRLAGTLELPLRVDPEITPRDDGDDAPLAIAPSLAGLRRRLGATGAALDGDGPTSADRADVSGAKHCGAGSASLVVDPFGDVLPCVQWRRRVGNVRDTSLALLWGSTAFDEVREALTGVHATLGPAPDHCPGIARAITGDPCGCTPQTELLRTARSLPIVR